MCFAREPRHTRCARGSPSCRNAFAFLRAPFVHFPSSSTSAAVARVRRVPGSTWCMGREIDDRRRRRLWLTLAGARWRAREAFVFTPLGKPEHRHVIDTYSFKDFAMSNALGTVVMNTICSLRTAFVLSNTQHEVRCRREWLSEKAPDSRTINPSFESRYRRSSVEHIAHLQ